MLTTLRLQKGCSIPVAWKKPEKGWIKLNFDRSVRGETGLASIGGLLRNHKGEFILGYAEKICPTTSTTIAEVAALLRGLEQALEKGQHKVWLEGDAKAVVEAIMTPRKFKCAIAQRCIIKINSILLRLSSSVVTHVYREGNRAADKLASLGHLVERPQIWRNIPPSELLPILRQDAEGTIILRHRKTPSLDLTCSLQQP